MPVPICTENQGGKKVTPIPGPSFLPEQFAQPLPTRGAKTGLNWKIPVVDSAQNLEAKAAAEAAADRTMARRYCPEAFRLRPAGELTCLLLDTERYCLLLHVLTLCPWLGTAARTWTAVLHQGSNLSSLQHSLQSSLLAQRARTQYTHTPRTDIRLRKTIPPSLSLDCCVRPLAAAPGPHR